MPICICNFKIAGRASAVLFDENYFRGGSFVKKLSLNQKFSHKETGMGTFI